MLYIEIFFSTKNGKFHQKNVDIFLIFAQNINCGYSLVTSAHNLCFGAKIRKIGIPLHYNLCFGAKIRKIGIPLHYPVLLYKSGV